VSPCDHELAKLSSLKDRSVQLKIELFVQSAEADGFNCLLRGSMNIHCKENQLSQSLLGRTFPVEDHFKESLSASSNSKIQWHFTYGPK